MAESARQGKEQVLKRLLATQETYIAELEAKCRSMAEQITESPFKPKQPKTGLEVAAIVKQKKPLVEKMQDLAEHIAQHQGTDSGLKSLCDGLRTLRHEAQIESEVAAARDQ